ncbi:MAG: hypothetical protein G3M70_11635 [Candidatus Nitronauta litoralis]|uniref:Lipoprotein n=1 Tax=Candidatus Nitronauta litoralis TaxID=2705533 RepID=A0A7T0BX05_9BACT|nr:MAG: hypothetical protein G3M70_11635 [Candidatus Nitronauta litoralis]
MIVHRVSSNFKAFTSFLLFVFYAMTLSGCETVPKTKQKASKQIVRSESLVDEKILEKKKKPPFDAEGKRILLKDMRHKGDRFEMFVRPEKQPESKLIPNVPRKVDPSSPLKSFDTEISHSANRKKPVDRKRLEKLFNSLKLDKPVLKRGNRSTTKKIGINLSGTEYDLAQD